MSLFGKNPFNVSPQDKALKVAVYIFLFLYCAYIGYSIAHSDLDNSYPQTELLIPFAVFMIFQSYFSHKYGYIYNKGTYITRDQNPKQFGFWLIFFRVCAVALPLIYIYIHFF